jgi:integrase
VGRLADRRFAGSSGGALAAVSAALAEEPTAHPRRAEHPLGLRNVAGRRPATAESHGTREPRSLSTDEFHKLVDALSDDVCLRTMLLLSVSFGLRISEVLGLKWKDIDFFKKPLVADLRVRKWFGFWGGRRESNLTPYVKQRTSQRTESNVGPCKYMRTQKTDLHGFASTEF